MADEMIFDDEYTGPRWRYGMTHRPPAIGCQPAGRIVGADKKDRPTSRSIFGTVEYPRELTQAEIEGYELEPLGKVEQ